MKFDYREFRKKIGYTNASELKKYYKATDIADINWSKIEQYNQRIKDMFSAINRGIHDSIRHDHLEEFNLKIDEAYHILRENKIIPKLSNYGRSPEAVYYSWMRGYAVLEFFVDALAAVFNVPREAIRNVGHDQLTSIETFSQSPTADLEITLDDNRVRLEIQSGFTGANDIKAHKVKEAKKIFQNEQIVSYIVHFDLFNGCVAIVNISNINDDSIHWESRQQFESQRVFAIPDDAFKWFLPDELPCYADILF